MRTTASGRRIRELFSDIPWGTDQVLRQTAERAKGLGLSFALLEPLSDVDRPEDLDLWQQEAGVPPPVYLSIVIPARNEAQEIGATLDAATHLLAGFDAKIRQALARPHLTGGAFSLRLDSYLDSLKVIE